MGEPGSCERNGFLQVQVKRKRRLDQGTLRYREEYESGDRQYPRLVKLLADDSVNIKSIDCFINLLVLQQHELLR